MTSSRSLRRRQSTGPTTNGDLPQVSGAIEPMPRPRGTWIGRENRDASAFRVVGGRRDGDRLVGGAGGGRGGGERATARRRELRAGGLGRWPMGGLRVGGVQPARW